MLRLKRVAAVAAILAAAACTADGRSPTAVLDGPRKTISDAAHSGAVPGFYFLPPMVPQPTYSGTFDAALQPRVEICELSGTSCGTTIATFTFGTGASNVKVDAAGQTYQVNWKTSDSNLDVNKNYRISVYQGTFLLGFADVDVVGTAKDLKNVDTQQYIPLLDDRTLPIKFRVETGIPAFVAVSPASDSVYVGDTRQFTATVTDLHGNTVSATVTWSSNPTSVATVDGTGLATGVAQGTAKSNDPSASPNAYYVDMLFRPAANVRAPGGAAAAAESFAANREAQAVFTHDMTMTTDWPAADRTFLAQLVSARTGLAGADAEKRVNDTIAAAKADADKARKAAASLSIWLTISMFVGAFAASLAAIEGGQLRDDRWKGVIGARAYREQQAL